ncbi:MAG: hypothetical protein FWD71_11300 [Oscillospiraceae bacterium]|nr:hypothetical protein [Oscillospiraceae bacterium]
MAPTSNSTKHPPSADGTLFTKEGKELVHGPFIIDSYYNKYLLHCNSTK